VICSPTAASAIKTYSPDLIVHPILREDRSVLLPFSFSLLMMRDTSCRSTESVRSELNGLLERLHVLVIGPGLGREDYMQQFARLALSLAKEQDMYVVLDADALWMVQKDPEVVRGYHKAVLTPNVVEFKRLSETVVRPSIQADRSVFLRSIIRDLGHSSRLSSLLPRLDHLAKTGRGNSLAKGPERHYILFSF
jgi:ATP-dependent NAD(P)H-hydrate dehydratase